MQLRLYYPPEKTGSVSFTFLTKSRLPLFIRYEASNQVSRLPTYVPNWLEHQHDPNIELNNWCPNLQFITA